MRVTALVLMLSCLALGACQRNTPPPANPAPTNTEPAPAPAVHAA